MLLFAFSASYFSLLAQRISNQKKVHPSFRFFLALLGLSGGKQELAPLELKQLLAENPRQPCVARRSSLLRRRLTRAAMLSVAAVANNAREPKAVMAVCPPLWLLSAGQAPESDSPTGEKEPSIKRTTFYPQLTSFGLRPYRNNAKRYIYD
jgi:hypothetical protein